MLVALLCGTNHIVWRVSTVYYRLPINHSTSTLVIKLCTFYWANWTWTSVICKRDSGMWAEFCVRNRTSICILYLVTELVTLCGYNCKGLFIFEAKDFLKWTLFEAIETKKIKLKIKFIEIKTNSFFVPAMQLYTNYYVNQFIYGTFLFILK